MLLACCVAAAALSQAEREEKEKATTQLPGNTFENISLNKERVQGPGGAGRRGSDLIFAAAAGPSRCQAQAELAAHGPHRAGAPPGKMSLLVGSADAQPDLQGSDEQMFFPVSTSPVNRRFLMAAGFQALNFMLGKR